MIISARALSEMQVMATGMRTTRSKVRLWGSGGELLIRRVANLTAFLDEVKNRDGAVVTSQFWRS
jgi:hypothetical protein